MATIIATVDAARRAAAAVRIASHSHSFGQTKVEKRKTEEKEKKKKRKKANPTIIFIGNKQSRKSCQVCTFTDNLGSLFLKYLQKRK